RVKEKLVAADTLPATSVWRTSTAFDPSAAAKLLLQVAPASVEYSTSAPLSTPVRASVPLLVMPSAAPVSWSSATPGAAAPVSRVKEKLVAADTLPATSVWRTSTAFDPSAAAKLLLQVAPASVEYSTSAPLSTPVRASVPLLVMPSAAPVSWSSATPGAAAPVSR